MSTDPFNIINHVDYKEHMKAYVLKKNLTSMIEQANKEEAKHIQNNKDMLKELNIMKKVYIESLKRCPLPVKPLCPIIPLEQNLEYIAMKKRDKALLTKCPNLSEAKDKLNNLEKECIAPEKKCIASEKEHIEKHVDYPSLIAHWRKQMDNMKAVLEKEYQTRLNVENSKLETEMKRKLRTDIRSHPDYTYFKNYYEARIAELQKTVNECHEQTGRNITVSESRKAPFIEEPKGFLKIKVPMLNSSGKVSNNTYAYKPRC